MLDEQIYRHFFNAEIFGGVSINDLNEIFTHVMIDEELKTCYHSAILIVPALIPCCYLMNFSSILLAYAGHYY